LGGTKDGKRRSATSSETYVMVLESSEKFLPRWKKGSPRYQIVLISPRNLRVPMKMRVVRQLSFLQFASLHMPPSSSPIWVLAMTPYFVVLEIMVPVAYNTEPCCTDSTHVASCDDNVDGNTPSVWRVDPCPGNCCVNTVETELGSGRWNSC
jgi:hypothetical protein